ncbi:unnamed protein product [Lymnaea stagnalis]|uniref:protein-serine/threonine phosphatase n=1 Tax=Lymnaea stagnalis TaxID=6523 RepID=A0AAV2I4L3_LYMST
METLLNDDRPCNIQELENIITAPSGGIVMLPSTAYDEVCDGIFLGEGYSAKSIHCMLQLKVTHVLNAALGKDAYHVNTNHVMYNKKNIQFLGIEATDFINCDMSKYFYMASDFIENGLKGGGTVFVHCVQGVSRSATLVVAYLMIKKHMTVQDALRLVRSKREVSPNPGFLQQLCDLHEKLKNAGHFAVEKPTPERTVSEQRLRQEHHSTEDSQAPHSVVEMAETCSAEELESILTGPSGGLMMLPASACNAITDHIYIGDGELINKPDSIQQLEITHILNAAYNKGCKSDTDLYKTLGVMFLGIEAMDTLKFNMSSFFETAANFIDEAVQMKGRVFVHCEHGVSRSATLVVAYFMIKQHMPVKTAIKTVREKREICPNANFLQQLCDLNMILQDSGHFETT